MGIDDYTYNTSNKGKYTRYIQYIIGILGICKNSLTRFTNTRLLRGSRIIIITLYYTFARVRRVIGPNSLEQLHRYF